MGGRENCILWGVRQILSQELREIWIIKHMTVLTLRHIPTAIASTHMCVRRAHKMLEALLTTFPT